MTDARAASSAAQQPTQDTESTATIAVAVVVNVLIAICKTVAASVTGSSAMLSEAIHSAVDALNEALLFVGVVRGKRAPDATHPLGHGQELYFWTLIVAVVIFGAGGSVSIVEGIGRLIEPHPVENAVWSYAVLGASIVLESISWVVAYRALRSSVGRTSTWRVIRESKDPTVFTVLLEDTAALVGLSIALAGTILTQHGIANADGIASILIGVVLCIVAIIVIRESRGLLVGESAVPAVRRGIAAILAADPAVARKKSIVTLHFGPQNVLVMLTVDFTPLSSTELAAASERIRGRIVSDFPVVSTVALTVPRPAGTAHGHDM